MATETQVTFAGTLHEERELEFDAEEFATLSVEDASAAIDVLLNEVESGPITDEQSARIAELLDVVGPRNDGQEWQIPSDRGRAGSFIRSLEKWARGKAYGERKDAFRASLAAKGVNVTPSATPVADAVAAVETDDIPF